MKSKKTANQGNDSPKNGAGRYPLRSSIDGVRVLRSMSNEKSKSTPESSSTPADPAPAKGKRKRKINRAQNNELSLIRKRVRYMLQRMKYEHSLLDAYSGEGWKGRSSDMIKPEKELERAKSEILRRKIRVRHAFRNLDMLLSEGKIEDSFFDSKGEIDSEDICCSKCGSKDLYADNDIILCDGCCNRAFHQKCVNPPLQTEEIPPGEEGWLCPECVCKFDCLELVNEFTGGDLSIMDSWEKVFPEAATSTNGNKQLHGTSFPSDDSEDNDYDPDVGESDTDNQNDASCSELSESTSLSDEPGPSNKKIADDYLGLPSEDSEDDDYDPEGPDPFKDMQKEGPTSDGSDFSSDSDDYCAELCKISSNNEISKLPDDLGDARYMVEKHQPALESDPGQGRQEPLDFKNPYDETFGESSTGSSDDEDWTEKTTPKKVKRGDVNQEGISVMRETRSRSFEKQKNLCGGNPKREEDHIVGHSVIEQKQVMPRGKADQNSKHDESNTPIANGSKSEAYARRNFSQQRSQKLHDYFKENQYPSRQTKERISEELGMTPKQVDSWFANTRHKFKVCSKDVCAGPGPSVEGSVKEANHPGHSIEVPTIERDQPGVATEFSYAKVETITEFNRNNTKPDHEAVQSSESNKESNKTRDDTGGGNVQHTGNMLDIEMDEKRRKAVARELRRMKNK